MTDLPWTQQLLGWLLGVGAGATALLWGVVWYGVEYSMRTIPTLRRGQRLAAADPPAESVCVVVPAHNERQTIEGLVRSLRAQTHRQLRFVLALDRCTDDTEALARAAIGGDPRFEIVAIDACPDDWAGKVHAVHVGIARSRGAHDAQFLLFADADTIFAPECISAALALLRERRLDLLSLLSTLTYDTWFERIVQTAASFELLRQYPLARSNGLHVSRPFANGQFMLFTRAAYEAIGGHAAVKSSLLEDVALARRVGDAGRKGGVFLADGLLHCRMYANWPEFQRGWKRIYMESAHRRPARLAFSAVRIRFLGTLLPVLTLACGVTGAAVVAQGHITGWALIASWLVATLVWLGALVRIATLAHAPAWTAPLHAAGAWVTGTLLAEAADDVRSRRRVQWGGRSYEVGAGQATVVGHEVHGRTGGDPAPAVTTGATAPRQAGFAARERA